MISGFFSGCEIVDSALQLKQDAETQIAELQQSIEDIQNNIEEKKILLDEKLAQIEAAQKAISDLLGSSEEEDKEQEIQQLKSEALLLQKEVQTLRSAEQERLEDMSEFSIE